MNIDAQDIIVMIVVFFAVINGVLAYWWKRECKKMGEYCSFFILFLQDRKFINLPSEKITFLKKYMNKNNT